MIPYDSRISWALYLVDRLVVEGAKSITASQQNGLAQKGRQNHGRRENGNNPCCQVRQVLFSSKLGS